MFLSLRLLLLALWLTLHGRVETGTVVGGHKAAPHSRPYMALLEMTTADGKTQHCGGFLLTEDFVMTAAHCNASNYTVYLGLDNYRNRAEAQKLSVKKSYPHEEFNFNDVKHDIMLLQLSTNAEFTRTVSPIDLERADVPDPRSCAVAGWGKTNRDKGHMSHVLREGNVKLIDAAECAEDYCSSGATAPGGGDSGGPLVCGNGAGKVYGVISAYNSHSKINYYIKISNYNKWIDSIMKNGSQSGI
ncbi:granzyme G-like [Pungitius pungitius]|uniref:granzyme G-like n=1 Tax=Pungitius pungitius TaxID=134920 RepID=UPI002E0EDA68